MLFSREWFKKYQWILLFFANTKIGRWFFRINGKRSAVGKRKIIKIEPNAITWVAGYKGIKKQFSTEFRTHNKFSRRLFYGLYPVWWIFHQWDILVANVLFPSLNLGFDSLTFYPDAHTETNSVDGYAGRFTAGSESWVTITAREGNQGSDTEAILAIGCGHRAGGGNWYRVFRSIIVFDTSTLPNYLKINSAVLSVYGSSKLDNIGIAPAIGITQGYSAINTAIAVTDYLLSNWLNPTTRLCDTDITYAGFSTSGYNDFNLNAAGKGIIDKLGVTKIGIRLAKDIDATDPGGSILADTQLNAFSADAAGTSTDPKLVVTYELTNKFFQMF
jgi:hypothetical protein